MAEVLSPGTKALDRGIKADKYQSIPSIQEILFIDTQIMRVQLWQCQPDCWTMRNFVQGDTIQLRCADIHFTVEEVYEKRLLTRRFLLKSKMVPRNQFSCPNTASRFAAFLAG